MGFSKTGLTLSSFCLAACLLNPAPSLADRHCLPALNAYYGARYALHDESAACAPALEQAFEALRSAMDHANVCGCGELVEAIKPLVEAQGGDEASCRSRAAEILGQSERMKALVDTCNH